MKKTLLLFCIAFSLFLNPHLTFAQCFSDNFESGTLAPGWNPGTGHTQTIVNTNPAEGSYSLQQTGVSGFYIGPHHFFSPIQPTEISWWIKSGGNSNPHGYFVVGDGNIVSDNGILFSYCNGAANSLRFFNTSGYNHPISPNTWYFVEIKDIDWTARNMDIYVDGNLILNNWAFRSNTATSVDRVHMFNLASNTAFYDDIRIGCGSDPDDDGDGIGNGQDNCPDTWNGDQADSDCDGVGDACDVCDGGDDSIDNNGDGLPDCDNNPGFANIPAAWKCSNGTRVSVCYYSPNGSRNTICVLPNSVNTYLLARPLSYIGPCGNADCNETRAAFGNFGTGDDYQLVEPLMVSPNPVTTDLNIEIDPNLLGQDVVLTLRDQLGRPVWSQQFRQLESTSIQLNVVEFGFAPGVYTLSMQNDGGVSTKQVVLSK